MATLNELKYDALMLMTGASPPISLNDVECLWLQSRGHTGSLNEMWAKEFLFGGAQKGSWNGMAYEWLGLQGSIGQTLNERWYEFWQVGGLGGVELISDTDALASMWVPRGGNTVTDAINAVDIKYVDNTGGAYLPLSTTTILTEALLDGYKYRITWVTLTVGEFYMGKTSQPDPKFMKSGLNGLEFKPEGSTDLDPAFLNINLLAGQQETINHGIRVWKVLGKPPELAVTHEGVNVTHDGELVYYTGYPLP